MKNPKIVFIILLCALAGCNLFILSQYKHLQKTNRELTSGLIPLSKGKEEAEELKKNMLFQQLSEGACCASLEIKDPESKQNILLSSLAKDHARLFLRIHENQCDACVQQALNLLSYSLPDMEITLLSGYKNIRQFYAYAETYRTQFIIYNTEKLPMKTEDQDQPYFFVLTPDSKLQNIFIPSLKNDKLTRDYIRAMQDKHRIKKLSSQAYTSE